MLFVVVRTTSGPKDQNLTFTEFSAKVKAGSVDKVTITGNEVHGTYKSNPNATLHTFIPVNYPDIIKEMQENGVNVDIKDAIPSGWVSILINASPFSCISLMMSG